MLSRTKFMEIMGNNIKSVRTKKRISQEELSAQCGFSRTYINLIESAKLTPSCYNVYRIAKALNITVDELYPSTV